MSKHKLSEVAKFDASKYDPEDNWDYVNYLDTGNVTKGTIESIQHIDLKNEKLPSRARVKVGENTIIYSTVRPIQEHYAIIKNVPENFLVSTGFATIDVDEKIANPYYVYYLLTKKDIVERLHNIATTSTSSYPSITSDSIKELSFDFPRLDEQKRIVSILNAIDSKIELNNKISALLEEQAKVIYDYWFTQFDFPDENGKPYKSSGGKMVWNEELKREIPDGWEVGSLRGYYTIDRGISYTSTDIKDGVGTPMLNLACIDTNRNYRDGQLKYYNNTIPNDKKLVGYELLIACTDLTRNADIVGSPILVPKLANEMTYSMDMAKLSVNDTVFNKYYLYMALRTEYYHNFIKKYASGTNVLHLNLDGLNWYNMAIPPVYLQEQFGQIVKAVQNNMNKSLKENRELSSLRDFLLPLLMNGQCTIEE